ncbi:ribosomal protein S18-alanine N-acetyltransferase [Leucobacter chinensis]|uniref:ribosomal protein S18-alanine N-acetyltransferase n=1 Tax=Leucobacter chinensis TaxID=2851010 RepID=UPI001C2359E6
MTTDSTELVWRDAKSDDATAIALLERELFGSTAWPEEVVREELEGPYRAYTVIEHKGSIVAYGGVLSVGGDGDVQTIAVTESYRGRGLGKQLLRRLLRDAVALGATRVFLEVRADNPVAITLYERSGFEHIGVRRGYYQPDNIDALIMCNSTLQEASE